MIKSRENSSGDGRRPIVLTATEGSPLLEFLFAQLGDKSRTTVRSYLRNGQVDINGTPTTQFDTLIKKGDKVTITFETVVAPFKHPLLKILFEDDHIIVVNKHNGLLSMGTNKQRTKCAYYILSEYLKKKDPKARIFIVHRLDRETSGIMIFAKSMDVQHDFQYNWKSIVSERKYVAVVSPPPSKDEGTIFSYLAQNKALVVYSTQDPTKGEPATTHFKTLKRSERYSLLELMLETGKKNQIRVHLKDIGSPIVGDKKYEGVESKINRVALHAIKIKFTHPITMQEMAFSTEVPSQFLELLKK